MLGDVIGESRGKRIVRRVLSSDPLTVEVSFEDSGKLLGIDVTGFGTYTATVGADRILYGEGNGTYLTADGEPVTWKGSARGKFTTDGGVSYRGILYYRSPSPKLSRLNMMAAVFEYEVDASGNAHAKVWEWK